MSLFRSIKRFASTPQGRRTIQQVRQRVDTPANRQKANAYLTKAKGTRRKPTA